VDAAARAVSSGSGTVTLDDVVGLYRLFDAAGIRAWIDGGWAVDALVGRQLRDHADLDLAVDSRDDARFREVAAASGFAVERVDGPHNQVWADVSGRRLDVHLFVRDEAGQVVGGILYPTESLTGHGVLGGLPVRCIAPRSMLEFLTPLVGAHAWKYVPAIDALCERYGFERPPEWVAVSRRRPARARRRRASSS
jgi:lincosamide nucleotidyltransferase A/C/D/E